LKPAVWMMAFNLLFRIVFVAPVLGAALALSACGEKSNGAEQADNARPVLVAPVHLSLQSQPRDFVAAIRPRIEADHAFRVGGKVVRRFVEVGQRVAKGDVLALLDEADLRSQKEQAEADYSASRAALDQAAADEKRAIKLHTEGWTAKAALDRQRTAAEEARGRFQRASRALDLAKNSLDYATLRADADGVVTQVSVEPGQVVASGQTVVRIARTGELEAAVALPESFAAAADSGKAQLTLWSNPQKKYRAKLRELSPSADPASRTFGARFSLPDADSAVAIGMTGTLTIENPNAAPAVNVPLSALFNQGKGAALWKVDDAGRLTLTPVNVLRYDSRSALVEGPIGEGDNIVVLGVQKLDPTQKVRIVKQEVF
jgi:RND family efflux transporter MFP subunit